MNGAPQGSVLEAFCVWCHRLLPKTHSLDATGTLVVVVHAAPTPCSRFIPPAGGKAFTVQLLPSSLADEAGDDDVVDDGNVALPSAPSMPPGPTKWERLVLWRGEEGCDCDLSASVLAKHSLDCGAPLVEVPDILCR